MELLTRSKIIDSQTERHHVPEGLTVAEVMTAIHWDKALYDYTVVTIDGREVPRNVWENHRPDEGREIRIMLRPGGGGGGGGGGGSKGLIAAVAAVAVMVVAVIVAPYIAPLIVGSGSAYLGATTAAVTAAISIAGSLAIGALIKPPQMSNRALTQNAAGAGGLPAEGSLYSVTGSTNQFSPYGIVPRIFGRARVAPNLAAEPVVISSGPVQTLRLLLDFGYGPLLIEDVRIGTTPITQFPTARYIVHTYYKKGDPLQIYTNDQSTLNVGATLTELVDNIRAAPQDCNAIYLEFGFPGGLGQYNEQGQSFERREHITVLVRDVANNGGYISIGDMPHWAWFSSNDVSGVGQTGDVMITSFSPLYAFKEEKQILVQYGWGVFQVGQTVRWVGNQYQITAVDTTTPSPDYAPGSYYVTLSGLPDGIAWGQTGGANDDPNMAYRPLWEQPQPSVWELSYSSQAGSIRVEFGAAIYDVEFIGRTRVPRTVTVAMMLPYYSEWEVLVRRSTPVSADPLIANGITWATLRAEAWRAPIAPNVPRTIMEVEVTASEEINGQVQNINALATSYYWDPRYQQMVVSRSPALAYMDLLTGGANKKKVDWGRLDYTRLWAWHDWCAAASPQGDENATCDMVVDYRATVGEIAQTICAAGRAAPTVIEGLYSVMTEEQDRVPVQMFTPRNAHEFTTNRVWVDEPQAVKIRYVSETTWERAEVIAYMDGYDQNNTTKYDTLDLVGTTRPWQAWRMGRYYLAAARLRKEKMSLMTDVENLVCQRGDLVLVAHDQLLKSAVARVRDVNAGLITMDADFPSEFYSEAFTEYPANAGSPTSFPPGWTTSIAGLAGVVVTVIGKGADAEGRGYCDFRITKSVAGGSANAVQIVTGDGVYYDINSDDDIVTVADFVVLAQTNFVGNQIRLAIQPTNSTNGTGLGTVMSGVRPFPELNTRTVENFTATPGNTLGLTNGWKPLLEFGWAPTTDYPATMDIRIFTPRHYVNNKKPDLLQRVDAEKVRYVPNAEAAGAKLGLLSGNGGDVSSPGKLPDGWYQAQYGGTWVREIVRLDDVWSYHDFDIRLTADAGQSYCSIVFVNAAPLPASKIIFGSVAIRQVAVVGTPPTVALRFTAQKEDGAFISNSQTGALTISTTQEIRVTAGPTNYSATTDAARFAFAITFSPVAGQATDVTYRIRLPLVGDTVDPTTGLPTPVEPEAVYAQIRTKDGVLHDPVQIIAAPSSDQVALASSVGEDYGDLIALGKVDEIVTEWIVDGISPGTELSAQLTLIEHAPELNTVDEAPIPPYVPPNSDTGMITEYGPVRDLVFLVSETYQDTYSVNAVKVNWNNPGYAVEHYIVERVLGTDGNRTFLGFVTDARFLETIPTEGIPPGGISVEYFITPVTALGKRGQVSSVSGLVLPDLSIPDAPLMTSNVMGSMTRLLWTIPKAPDVVSYQIRWSPDYTTSAWNKMQILARSVASTTNTMSVHTRPGLYAIRAVDRAGNWSPVDYTRTAVDLTPAVDTSYTIVGPPWTGTFENCELDGDGNLVLKKDPTTGLYYPAGTFRFTDSLVLSRVWRVRLESQIVMTSFPDDALNSTHDGQVLTQAAKDLPLLNSAWFTPLASAVPLAGGPTSYSEWTPVVTEWMDGKIFQFGVWLRSFDGITTPVVKSIVMDVFFDPRSESKADVPAPGGLLTVVYRYPFLQTPGLQLTLNNGDKDDYIIRTASSPTGFSLEVRSGNDQLVSGRNIDWTATGIGIGL